jgi:hypothetical protein
LIGELKLGPDKQVSLEESFKSSLEDVVLIAGKLQPYCSDVSELIEMVKLAQTNESQRKLIFNICAQQGKR